MDFKQAIDLFSNFRQAEGQNSQTIKGYDREIRNFAVFSRKKEVEDVTVKDVVDYMNSTREFGWSHNSFIPKGSALKKFFHFIKVQNFGIKTLSPDAIPMPRKKFTSVPRVVTEDSYRRILNVIPKDSNDPRHIRNLAFINLLWDTGARNGELLSMNIDDNLDLKRNTAIIRTEKSRGKKPFRHIFWNEQTNENIKRWIDKRERLVNNSKLADPYALFLAISGQNAGKRFTTKGSGEMLRRYSRKAGISYTVNAHSFRHHKGHDIVHNGGSAHDVKNLLGHSSVDSSTIYTEMVGREAEERYRRFTRPLMPEIEREENKEWEQERDRFNAGEIFINHSINFPIKGLPQQESVAVEQEQNR